MPGTCITRWKLYRRLLYGSIVPPWNWWNVQYHTNTENKDFRCRWNQFTFRLMHSFYLFQRRCQNFAWTQWVFNLLWVHFSWKFFSLGLQGYPLSLKPEIICDSPEETSWLATLKNISFIQVISLWVHLKFCATWNFVWIFIIINNLNFLSSIFLSAVISLVVIGTQFQIADLLAQYILEVRLQDYSPFPKLTEFLIKCSIVESLMSLAISKTEKLREVSTVRSLYLLLVFSEIILGSAFLHHISNGVLAICKCFSCQHILN